MVRIRVLVVDDHRIFAESLAAALAAEPDVDVSAAGSGPAALRCLERAAAEGRRFDVLLVDADLGGNVPGIRPAVPVQEGDEDGLVDGISLVAGVRPRSRRYVSSSSPRRTTRAGPRSPCRPAPRAGSPRTAHCPGCSPSSGACCATRRICRPPCSPASCAS